MSKAQMKAEGFCLSLEKQSTQKTPQPWPIILFLLNIFFPGWGTIIGSFLGGSKVLICGIIVGLVQLFTCWFIVGWIWSIWWGWIIFKKGM